MAKELKLTKEAKKQMLHDYIIVSDRAGYSSVDIMGMRLSEFNYIKVFEMICKYNNECIEQGGYDHFERLDKPYYGFFK